MPDIPGEIWKDIKGYEGDYQVSNAGRIRSVDRVVTRKDGFKTRLPGVVFVLQKNKLGYMQVNIRGRTTKVHRAVAAAFIGPSKMEVNHKDGNKANNNVGNLEYVTRGENILHASRTGLRIYVGTKGEKHPQVKLTEKSVLEIRQLAKQGIPQNKIAKKYGICQMSVSRIHRKERWGHI